MPDKTIIAQKLKLAFQLIKALNQEGLSYCHWKSNEHLMAGLMGNTDIDLLIDQDNYDRFADIFSSLGFKQFLSPQSGKYPGIEDLIGMDEATGNLIHIHLHSQLVLGQSKIKEYRLPWEKAILADCVIDQESKMPIIHPNFEFLLLNLRRAIKLTPWTRILSVLGKSNQYQDFLKEYKWLENRIDRHETIKLALHLFGVEIAEIFNHLIEAGPSRTNSVKLRKSLLPVLAPYKRLSQLTIWKKSISVKSKLVFSKFLSASPFRAFEYSKKIPARGGVLVAIIGIDGSGKSTVAREINTWLSWKLQTHLEYFGSGDGPKSFSRFALFQLAALIRKGKSSNPSNSQKSKAGTPQRGEENFFRGLYKFVFGILLAREKSRKLLASKRRRNKGQIVVTDRFPQAQVPGMMDGPLLSHLGNSRFKLLKNVAAWEKSKYEMAKDFPPDLVIKLTISPEAAHERKPEGALENLKSRMMALNEFTFPSSSRMVSIETNAPIKKVILQVKREIWNML